MTGPHEESGWAPSPELLAAYFDGEYEGRDDLAVVRRRLENWLAASPRGRAELAQYRRLRQVWLESTPPEPAPAAWQQVRDRLDAAQAGMPIPTKRRQHRRWQAAALLTAACALLAAGLLKEPVVTSVDDAPFPVASAREVLILQVEGDDTGTLVVGAMPVEGPLELVGPSEVTLPSAQPAQRDNMVPDFEGNGPRPPMIWARAEAEGD